MVGLVIKKNLNFTLAKKEKLCDNRQAAFSRCRPHRLAVRTPPFQGGNTGSSPVGGTI